MWRIQSCSLNIHRENNTSFKSQSKYSTLIPKPLVRILSQIVLVDTLFKNRERHLVSKLSNFLRNSQYSYTAYIWIQSHLSPIISVSGSRLDFGEDVFPAGDFIYCFMLIETSPRVDVDTVWYYIVFECPIFKVWNKKNTYLFMQAFRWFYILFSVCMSLYLCGMTVFIVFGPVNHFCDFFFCKKQHFTNNLT